MQIDTLECGVRACGSGLLLMTSKVLEEVARIKRVPFGDYR